MDDYVLIRRTVKYFYKGKTKLGNTDCNNYVRCIIDTSFGELELIHSYNQVDDNQAENMHNGVIVSGVFVLSGDAAIYEYENGIVKDEEHHLRLLRHVITTSETKRLTGVLSENTEYISDGSAKVYVGDQEIIDRFDTILKENENKYFAYMATITHINNDTEEAIQYKIGRRCVVLAYGEPNNYESICFVDMDEENNISRIHICKDSRYSFCIDEKFVPTQPDIIYPEGYFCILFPDDVHKTKTMLNAQSKVTKGVFKINI